MNTSKNLHEVLFISTLAPDAPIGIVADITRKARTSNKARDITGLLIFDGLRFCEQAEGSEAEIMALMERICDDPRHINLEILHHGPLDQRRFKGFSMGYAEVEDPDVLVRLERLHGPSALAAFSALLPALDLGV